MAQFEKRIFLDLHISYDDFEQVYRGQVNQVFAYALDGRSIKFPANVLRPFLIHQGVHGRFCLVFDQMHKFIGIEKIG